MAQKMITTPSISVCIATFNSGKTLDRCLSDIRSQNYPQNKIEIILGDGGSTDDTFKIAKKYKARVINVPSDKQHAEYNRGVAYNAAKGDLVLIVDHDNFLPSKNWLRDMVAPLLENPKMVATTTCFYHYDKKFALMDRYFALYGASEPLPYFLGKADRMIWGSKSWNLVGKAVDHGSYYEVDFEKDPRRVPSIGSNGTLMRRAVVSKYADVRPDHHYPIDVMVDVVMKGQTKFGFVKNSIIHLTHSRGFFEFMKRRKKFVEQYHFAETKRRRWSVVMPGDEMGVVLYIVYSLTLVGPIIRSTIEFLKKPDIAWYVHPGMCLATTLIYGWVTIKYKFFKPKALLT